MNKYTIYTTNQNPPRGYSKTDTATSREGGERNNRRINHNNGSRSNNPPTNRSLASFTDEVPPVGSIFVIVYKQRSMKYQFNKFQYKMKNVYDASSIIQGKSSLSSGISRINIHTLTWTVPSIYVKIKKRMPHSLHS